MFLSVNTKVLDPNGTVLDDLNSESELMGDTWRLPSRVQAGSGSDRGGIISGDKFPWDQPMIRQDGLNTTVRVPPYVIWEGELPAGRMVFLTPTIWEWDPGAGAWDGWLAWQKQTDEKYGQRAKDIFGKIWPVSTPVFERCSRSGSRPSRPSRACGRRSGSRCDGRSASTATQRTPTGRCLTR